MTDWAQAHADLSRLFAPEAHYAGYRPDVAEAPNGDTRECAMCHGEQERWYYEESYATRAACDGCDGTGRIPNTDAGRAGKRYLHIARKYLGHTGTPESTDWCMTCGVGWDKIRATGGVNATCGTFVFAEDYLARAHYEACLVATKLGVPAAFMPRAEFGALRVLEYPSAAHDYEPNPMGKGRSCSGCGATVGRPVTPSLCPALAAGAGTAEHTDIDLFTLNLWRSTPEDHEQETYTHDGGTQWARGTPVYHMGELGEIIGLGSAVAHRVPARPYTQRALVYFAIPDHAARLPSAKKHTWGSIATRNEYEIVEGCTVCGVHRFNRFDGPTCGVGPTVGEWLKVCRARGCTSDHVPRLRAELARMRAPKGAY